MKSILVVLLVGLLGLGNVAATEGPVIGIGVGVHSEGGHPVIDQVIPGNAAYKHGVKVGDRLLKVDGKSVDGMPLPDISNLLQGAQGSHVKITVDRSGSVMNFSLKRTIVTYPHPSTD